MVRDEAEGELLGGAACGGNEGSGDSLISGRY